MSSSNPSTRNVPEQRLSRKLSYVLRHGAVNLRLPINSAGFIPLAALRTNVSGLESLTDDILCRIVANDQKKRFSIWSDQHNHIHVRANQGHSLSVAAKIDPDQLLEPLSPHDVPSLCVHGTTFRAWQQISQTGLSKMNRQMIHFAVGLPSDDTVVSGMRKSSEILIFISLAAAMEDGVLFYRSDNKVILSPGVNDTGILPAKYFEKFIRRNTGQLLMENGRLK